MVILRDLRLATVAVCCAALAAVTACGSAHTVRTTAAASATHASRIGQTWIDQAHQADLAETEAGELAESGKGTQAIEPAGAMLVRDHQALGSKLIQVAKELNLGLPTSPSVAETETAEQLSSDSGQRFDQDFAASMVVAHETMISATRNEIDHGSAPAVVSLARQALPVLVKHLAMLRAIAKEG